MDKKGQMMIKLRKIKSRAWRHARKNNAPQREQRVLKRKYELQKRMTSIYLGKRKGEWEKEKILKARTNSKILWDFTKYISGKNKKKDEKAYIYIEGEKKALEMVWRIFIETWKKEIYQKEPRMDLTFWYGSAEEIGLKETMRREEAEKRSRGEEKMLPLPVMGEEDLVRIVKTQKNGNAAGIDCVKAETMKFMIKNRKSEKD